MFFMKLLLADPELLVGSEVGRKGVLPIPKVGNLLEDLALGKLSQIRGPVTIIKSLKG